MFKSLIKIAFRYIDLPTVKKSKHFCFVLRKKKLTTWGWNKRVSITSGRYTQHAEIHALGRLDAELRNHGCQENVCAKFQKFRRYEFVTFRINRKGEIGYGKPCQDCTIKLQNWGIRKVWYSNEEGKFQLMKL